MSEMRAGNLAADPPRSAPGKPRDALAGVGEQHAQREQEPAKGVGRRPAQKVFHVVLQGC